MLSIDCDLEFLLSSLLRMGDAFNGIGDEDELFLFVVLVVLVFSPLLVLVVSSCFPPLISATGMSSTSIGNSELPDAVGELTLTVAVADGFLSSVFPSQICK